MSGEGNLRPSSWKAEAIRRGDLKISGPIPITEDIPLNDTEEKEYAEKHSTDPAAELPEMPAHQPPPHPPLSQPQPHPRATNESLHSTSKFVEDTSQMQLDEEPVEHQAGPVSAPEPRTEQKRSPAEPVSQSYSTPSPFPSIPESNTQAAAKKRRKSGLRNAIRMMFGRKRKSGATEEDVSVSRHGYHRSEPITIHESPKITREDVSGPRISDLPVRELKPINPLGSHLPFPMNVNAPQEASPQHEYLTFDLPGQSNARRRASLSGILTGAEAQAVAATNNGSGKQSYDHQDGESLSSPQIGIALSSPPHSTTQSSQNVQQKRRSRSAGALRDLARGRPSNDRRRSEEIRFWRNSYQSGSVYSTATPRPRTAQTVETVRTIETQDQSPAKLPESAPTLEALQHVTAREESAGDARSVAVTQHDQDISRIPLPMETFNFGNLKADFADDHDHDDEVRGREQEKIPEAPARSEKRLSLEERVKHLEDDMRTLETSVRRISGRSNRQTIILENVPKGRRSRNRSSSATSDRQSSHYSSKSSSHNALHLTQHDPESPYPEHHPLSAVGEYPPRRERDRPETIIGPDHQSHTPRPATAPQAGLAAELAKLYEALKHERSCRKDLERQVYTLQRDVADLHAIVAKFISHSPSYPTPSPDTLVTSHSPDDRMNTPRAAAGIKQGRSDLILEGETLRHDPKARETIISRFSGTNSDFEEEEDHGNRSQGHSVSTSTEDMTSPESWATPKEESGAGFGSGFFFGSRKQSAEDEMF